MAYSVEKIKELETAYYLSDSLSEACRIAGVGYLTGSKMKRKYGWEKKKAELDKINNDKIEKANIITTRALIHSANEMLDLLRLTIDDIKRLTPFQRGSLWVSLNRSLLEAKIKTEMGTVGDVNILFNSPIPRSFTPEYIDDGEFEILNDNEGNGNGIKKLPLPKRRKIPSNWKGKNDRTGIDGTSRITSQDNYGNPEDI